MAYKVAQIRREASSGSGRYMEEITVTPVYVKSKSPFDPDNTASDFDDLAFEVVNGTDDEGNTVEKYFQKGQVYYLRIQILRVPQGYYSRSQQLRTYQDADTLRFSLFLRDKATEDGSATREDTIDLNQSFLVNSIPRENNSSNTYFTYTTVFIPRKNCKLLVLKLKRISYDVLGGKTRGRNWFNKSIDEDQVTIYKDTGDEESIQIQGNPSRIMYNGTEGDICKVNQIFTNSISALKIGFQARPGTLIVVNKAPIRIGRSGIYEINNGTRVNSVMITAPNGHQNSNIDAFLLDYAYES